MNKLISVLKVLLVEFVISMMLLLLVTFAMYHLAFDHMIAKILVYGIYVISTFAGGFFMGKVKKHKRLLWGALMGGLYFLVLMLISFLTLSDATDEFNYILSVALCISGGIVGGIIS